MKKLLLGFLAVVIFVIDVDAQSYDEFTWTSPAPNMSQKSAFKFGPDDSLYIGARGLFVYKDSTINHYNFYPLSGSYIKGIAFENNNIWLGTDSGLVKRSGSVIQVFNKSNSGMNSNRINDICFKGSDLYIATDSGITVYDGMTWTNTLLSDLQMTSRPISIGVNTFGVYLMESSGKIVYNSGTTWRVIYDTHPYQYGNRKFRSTNSDTLYIPGFPAYLTDTIIHYIEIPFDPCILKDNLFKKAYLFANPITYEKSLAISESTIDLKYLLRCDNLQPDLANVKENLNSSGQYDFNQIAEGEFYDYNSSGKLFWTNRTTTRQIFSMYLRLDSFPSNVPYDVCPYLDINQVRAKVMNDGGMFWDYTGDALYEVPKGSGTTSIFCQGLWIGGLDQNNQLHIAAQTYRQSGSDFWPGPLDTISATIDSVTHDIFDTIWKINRSTVDDFIWRFATGQVQNGSWTVPAIILNWPAEGSGNYSRSLAPYYDFNQDGHYNPYDGDYPDIKGSQMIWSVFNDNFGPHGTDESDRNLGVEIQASAYAYNCPMAINDDSVINYTTFYHYEIINRSDTDYHDVYIGNFTDVDLGNYLDDYVGCDTINDFGFGYNGDDNDDGLLGYGLHPPMINNLILKGPQADLLDGIDNDHDGVLDEQGEMCMMNNFTYWNNDASANGNPRTAMEHYYRIQSRWLDGSHVVTGGNGFLTPNGDSTNYMFSATPYSGLFWSEQVPDQQNPTPNYPSDRRFLISAGPFTLNAHQSKIIEFAYVYTRDPNSSNGLNTSIAKNTQDVLRIKQFYESNSFPCDNVISVNEIENIHSSLFPNPADHSIEIEIVARPNIDAQIKITDALGQLIFKKDLHGERKIRYSTEHLAPGIYLMNIISGDQMVSRKFVVQHGGR